MNLLTISAIVLIALCSSDSSVAGPSSVPLVKLASYHVYKKPINTVSDKFLSFTADPNTITHVADCQLTNATLNIAKSLTPAYFRLAGSESNHFVFQSNPNSDRSDPSSSKFEGIQVSSAEWFKLNEFFSKTGMNVIACVSGEAEPGNKNWDLGNTLELITFSDKHNMSLDWQLGYEVQKLTSAQGKIMGHDVARLRKILDVFPRYRNSLIIGPDMTSFKSRDDAIFIRNYLTEAENALDVFTWHPFSNKNSENDVSEMLSSGMALMDNYLWIKDGLLKSSSKGVVPKKSIWIAESANSNPDSISNLTDSMIWMTRMGTAAKLGASVYLRKPHLLSFYEPTPEYWVAALYKSLVGRTVLDIKQNSGNGTNKLQMFTHCTKYLSKPEESIINPEVFYEQGSVTVYGINPAPELARISFKIGWKADETAHLYALTEDASGDFPKTLLNKQPLGLSVNNELPVLSPKIRESPKYLTIPARSIFFIVFPNTKCRSCNELENQDANKSKTKIPDEEDLDTSAFTSNVLEVMEEENDHDAIYVSYPKRIENVMQLPNDPKAIFDTPDSSGPKHNVKYFTFTEDSWLNTFPQKYKDALTKEKEGSFETKDKSKAGKYRVLAQAIFGKRNVSSAPKELPRTETPSLKTFNEDDLENYEFKRALKYAGKFKRSLEIPESDELNSKHKSNYFVDENDSIERNQKFIKREEHSRSFNPKFPINVDSQEMALDLMNQHNIEFFPLDAEKRSVKSEIHAIPISQNNIRSIMKNNEFGEIIPIVTLWKKSVLENTLKGRTKRETTISENSTNPNETKNITQKLTTQSNDTLKEIDPSENLLKEETLPKDTTESPKQQENITKKPPSNKDLEPKPKLSSFIDSLNPKDIIEPEMVFESGNQDVIRENREVDDKQEANDAIIGNSHVKTMNQHNTRPVSPFPKKSKTLKSKSKANKLPENSDNLQMIHQSNPTPQSNPNEGKLSEKRSPQQVSSPQNDPELTKSPMVITEPEDSVGSSSSVIQSHPSTSKNQQETKKNHVKTTLEDLPKDITSLPKPKPQDVVSQPKDQPQDIVSQPKEESQNIGFLPEQEDVLVSKSNPLLPKLPKPKLATPLVPAKNNIKKPKIAPKPKMTPAQVRLSAEQRRRELAQKHLASLNKLRSLLGLPPTAINHQQKRDADVLGDTFEDTKKFLSDAFEKIKKWEQEKFPDIKIFKKDAERRKRDLNEEILQEGAETEDIQRQKRDNDVVGIPPPRVKNDPMKHHKELIQAHREELRRQREKIAQDKKKLLSRKETPSRHRRDLQQVIDQVKALKESKRKRINEQRQKLARLAEERKQKRVHLPIKRNKRDLQNLQERINDLRKKQQERHQGARKKQEHASEHPIEHPVEHAPTPSPLKTKIKSKIDEIRHQAADKQSKPAHKIDPKQKLHHVNKRNMDYDELERMAAVDLVMKSRFQLAIDPEVTPGQFFLKNGTTEINRNKRSINDNEIFDEDDVEIKSISKGHDKYFPKYNVPDLDDLMKKSSSVVTEPPSSTKVPSGNSRIIPSGGAAADSSQDNATCHMNNYNVFKYLWCLAHKLWYSIF